MAIFIKGLKKPPTPTTSTATERINPITAALGLSLGVASEPAEALPWEVVGNYTILDALKEVGTTARSGMVLWLVHKDNPAVRYRVRSWDSSSSRAVLEGHKKSQLKPVLTEREVKIYYPVWV